MLNQAAIEALYAATYVESYLDSVDNLPDDIQRNFTAIRNLDIRHQQILNELDQIKAQLKNQETDKATHLRLLQEAKILLISTQEISDEKLQLVQQIQDLIENKARQLELDAKNLDFGKDQENTDPALVTRNHTVPTGESAKQQSSTSVANNPTVSTSSTAVTGPPPAKRPRRQRIDSESHDTSDVISNASSAPPPTPIATNLVKTTTTASQSSGKKTQGKKRKRKGGRGGAAEAQETASVDPPIDPDEPTYCLCEQISYGEMIGCDNDQCQIEWFHFSCVALTTKPKGKWYCPKCRGDRPTVMKSRRSI